MPRRGGCAGVDAVHLRVMSEFGFSLGRWRDTSGDVQRPSPLGLTPPMGMLLH